MNQTPHDPDDFYHPDMGDMTVDQYAAWLEEHHDDEAWEPEEIEVSPNLSIVVSVRFNKGELDKVVTAAEAAGTKLSTYMRQVILDAVNTSPTSDEEFVRHLRALTESLRKSQEAAEHLARDMKVPKSWTDGSVSV
jgi:Mobilization protein NikA